MQVKPSHYRAILFIVIGIVIGYTSSFVVRRRAPNSVYDSSSAAVPASFEITDYDHTLGSSAAQNTLVVFDDLTCPYCKEYLVTLETLSNAGLPVRIVWRHFPLGLSDSDSLSAANAAECAGSQGVFWPFVFALGHASEVVTAELYSSLAENFQLDLNSFHQCLADNRFTGRVEADYNEGIMRGVIGSPANFLNGTYIPGAIPPERLKELLTSDD